MGLNWNQIGTKRILNWDPNWGQTGTKLAPNWSPNRSQTGTKLGPNLDQKGIPRGPWGVPWGSLGGLWDSLEGSLRDQTGTQLRSGTGPAPVRHWGPKKCRKCVTVVKTKQVQHWSGHGFAGSGRYQILGGLSICTPLEPEVVPTVIELSSTSPKLYKTTSLDPGSAWNLMQSRIP